MVGEELDVGAIILDLASVDLDSVVLTVKRSEAPLFGDDDLLLTGELVTSTTKSLDDDGLVGVLSADGNENLADIDTSSQTSRLTPGTTHTLLQTIGTGTRQHFVDT